MSKHKIHFSFYIYPLILPDKKNKKIIFHGSHKISKIKSNFFFIYYQLTNKELRNIPSFLYNALQCYKKQCSIL